MFMLEYVTWCSNFIRST